jgi:hypothetical protein
MTGRAKACATQMQHGRGHVNSELTVKLYSLRFLLRAARILICTCVLVPGHGPPPQF